MNTIAERGFWSGAGRLEMLYFLVHSVGLGCWLVRIPDVQSQLELDKAELATALLGFPVGTLLILAVANSLIRRIGVHRAWIVGHCLLYAALPILGFAPDQAGLFLGMILFGVALLLSQLAMNLQVDRLESETGVFVMSRCHGFFMTGLLVGIGVGVASKTFDMDTGPVFLLCSALLAPLGVFVIGKTTPRAIPASRLGRGPGVPSAGFLGLAVYLFGSTLSEGVIATWSTIYMLEILQRASDYAGLGFGFFIVMLAAGRFVGDHFKRTAGAVKTARVYIAVALAGVVLTVAAQGPVALTAGLGLVGFGIAVGFPYAMTAVAALSREATSNMAWLTFTAMMGFQFGPVVFGYLAEATSMQVSFGLLVPMLALSLLCSGRLGAPAKA